MQTLHGMQRVHSTCQPVRATSGHKCVLIVPAESSCEKLTWLLVLRIFLLKPLEDSLGGSRGSRSGVRTGHWRHWCMSELLHRASLHLHVKCIGIKCSDLQTQSSRNLFEAACLGILLGSISFHCGTTRSHGNKEGLRKQIQAV